MFMVCTVARALSPTNYRIVSQYPLKVPAGITSIGTGFYNGISIVGSGSGSATGGNFHALYWSTPTSTAVDLNPAGYNSSQAHYLDGSQIVGEAYNSGNSDGRAFLWNGNAQSAVDLQPPGFRFSTAYKAGNGWQVGAVWAEVGHAYLWHGSASSAIDLNPSGSSGSQALFTDGIQQLGSATFGHDHAMLWTGTAASAVDLNPAGYANSYGRAFSNGQQIGLADPNTGGRHAMLWQGTAQSAVDLNPAGWITSEGFSTNGFQQVGGGRVKVTDTQTRALLWTGTAASSVDLGALLPADTNSLARYIDANGHIFGFAWTGNLDYAVEWAAVPEPSTICLGLFSMAALGFRTRLQSARGW